MLTPCEKLKLCSMILEIGRLEKKIEAVRQLMCEHPDFAPFDVFRSLDIHQSNRICATDIQQFLTINCAEPNTAPPTLVACELFIKLFDRNSDNLLSYDEFLSAILPQDNNQLRQTAISKESTHNAQQLSQTSAMRSTSSAVESKEEIEYMLAKLIDWSIKGATDLESEKYAFLGLQQRGNIALFLEECFHAIDVNRSNELTTKSVSAFFVSNQQGAVDYSEEIRAFFRRASFSFIHHIDTISKSEFIMILDFAPYKSTNHNHNNNRITSGSKSRLNPPLCLVDNSYNNSFSSTPHATNGNIFDEADHPNAALVLRNTSYIAANSNSEPGSNNTMKSLFKSSQQQQQLPDSILAVAVPAAGLPSAPSSNKNPKRKLSFHASINERGEKEQGTNENQSTSNNNIYEPNRRRSSQYSVASQKSRSRQPPDERSIDSIHQQRVDEDNSRVGLIELLTNAKRSGAATTTSIASSSCRVSPANRVSVPSSRKSNQSRMSECLQQPFTFGGVGAPATPTNLINASFQSRASSRSRSSLRQSLIDFKQEIRGQLASSKARMESLSPMKTSTPQAKFNTSTKVEKQKQQQQQQASSLNQSQVFRASSQSSKNNTASQKQKDNSQSQLQNSFYSTVKSQSIRRQSISSSISNNNSSLNSSAYSHQQNNNPGSISNLQQSFTGMYDRRSTNNSRSSKQQQSTSGISGTSNKKKSTSTSAGAAGKQSSSTVKTLKQGMKTHLNNYFMNVLANAKRVELLKIELTARHDFNQFQLFELLDRQQRGSISSFDIHLFLASQSVTIPLPEIVILMKRLDRLRIGTVSFSSFSAAALTSAQHNRIGANRSGVSLLPEAALSRDTILVFTELLEALITAENKLELLRQTMSKDKHWDCKYAFDTIDTHKIGEINREQISIFLESEGYLASKKDLDLIMDFFEVEYAEPLRIDRFTAELAPKTLF